MPRHLLESSYQEGKLADAWGVNAPPEQVAGLGPFRFKAYAPGQRIVLERNPYYWKNDSDGQMLPYLDSIVSIFVANTDAETLRFEAGDTDVIGRLSAANFALLQAREKHGRFHVYDLGPGLEDEFLFFNQNSLPARGYDDLSAKQSWFVDVRFRQAISHAIDRAAIIRIAYRNRAVPLSAQVTPANKLWIDPTIAPVNHSVTKARELLRSSGFSWTQDGSLVDARHRTVQFSVLVNAANEQQVQVATLVQNDLKQLGIQAELDEVEFHTFVNRIFTAHRYEAALIGLADGDADPNSELNVLTSNGSAHVWSLNCGTEVPAWQREIDRLMHEQLTVRDYQQRKRLYDRVQHLMFENVPAIYLVSPNVLVGASDRVGNFHPAVLSSYTLWNAEQLFVRQ
jgi:peptide/nickel transport system substrate-binding protein